MTFAMLIRFLNEMKCTIIYLLVQNIEEHVELQYFVVVRQSTDKAYYDVDVHLVDDFYPVVLVRWNIFYLNEDRNHSNHK